MYDLRNHLRELSNTGPGGTVLSRYVYTLGPTGNRLGVQESEADTTGRFVEYVYDEVHRLVGERIEIGAKTASSWVAAGSWLH